MKRFLSILIVLALCVVPGSLRMDADHSHAYAETACAQCGDVYQNKHWVVEEVNGEEVHSYVCEHGVVIGDQTHVVETVWYVSMGKNVHYGECFDCGLVVVEETAHTAEIIAEEALQDPDASHCFHCADCNVYIGVTPAEDHNFDAEGVCADCGYVLEADEEHTHRHEEDEYWFGNFDADKHYHICADCGDPYDEAPHAMVTNINDAYTHNSWCNHCYYETDPISHTDADSDGYCDGCSTSMTLCLVCDEDSAGEWVAYTVNGTVFHQLVCAAHNLPAATIMHEDSSTFFEPVDADKHQGVCQHVWCDLVTPAEDHNFDAEGVCTDCGYIREVEVHKHVRRKYTTQPTCTEDGKLVVKCTSCWTVLSTEVLPATGHTMDENQQCTVCCYTNVPSLSADVVDAAAFIAIEGAAFAAAAEAEEAPAPATAVLVVKELTFEQSIFFLSENEIETVAERVFFIALYNEGESIQPTGEIKITLPVAEEGIELLTGKALMLLKEDGTLVEVSYEIVENQLVFRTAEIGVFIITEAPAAE